MMLGEGEPAAGPWQVAPLTELVRLLGPSGRATAGRLPAAASRCGTARPRGTPGVARALSRCRPAVSC